MVSRLSRLALLLLLCSTTAHAESRMWTDTSGKFHTDAELADFQDGQAYLQQAGGRIVSVPVGRLSQADRDFISTTVPAANVIKGKVVGVTDGDTLTVLDGSEPRKIRLEGIDAPESHQDFGTQAKKALSEKVFGKTVRVEWRANDKYGRALGHVFVDGHWINKDLAQEGWAWHYRQYSKSPVLAEAESKARAGHVGLWSAEDPTPPWEFRHPVAKAGANPEPQTAADKPTIKPSTKPNTVASSKPKSTTQTKTPKKQDPDPEPDTVDRNPNGEAVTGHTPTGIPTFTGPRGGVYHYSKNGNKVYSKKK